MMQKRVLAIHDISCVGRCSLTVALPILSAGGFETSLLPTALLSTHTGEFSGYTHLDLSDELPLIAKHFTDLHLPWDAIYSGYLASSYQVSLLMHIIDELANEDTFIFVDPAFADHGKLYSLLPPDMPESMRSLIQKAHAIVPNFTEACFLLGLPYEKSPTIDKVEQIAKALSELGPKQVVITGVQLNEKQTSVVLWEEKMKSPYWLHAPLQEGIFHGTGDVFASFLLTALLSDMPLLPATELALHLTQKSIRFTLQANQPLRYGVQFEKVLPTLIRKLNLP